MTPRIDIVIDQLIVEGTRDLSPQQLRAAVARELSRLLSTPTTSGREPTSMQIRRLEAIRPAAAGGSVAEVAGVVLARQLHGRIWR